jgi:Fe-S cluster assembly protein SufD
MAAVEKTGQHLLDAVEAVAMSGSQKQALAKLQASGFPTRHDEEFRFFDPARIVRTPWSAVSAAPDMSAMRACVDGLGLPESVVPIVLFEGRVVGELSALDRLPAGVTLVDAGADAWTTEASRSRTAFGSWTQARLESGVSIDVKAGTIVTAPLAIVSLYASNDTDAWSANRTKIVVGKSADLTFLDVHASVGSGDVAHLATSALFIDIKANARVERVLFHMLGEAGVAIIEGSVELARDGQYSQVACSISGARIRDTFGVAVNEPGAHAALFALVVAGDTQEVDHHTLIDHRTADATSQQLYKTILTGNGHGVFNGRIVVRQDAQRTAANQLSRALMLSRKARLDAKPQLEIFADDVTCTHGATVGQLDADELFYMASRAIRPSAARAMLIAGFAGEISDHIKAPALKAWAHEKIQSQVSIVSQQPV